MVRAKSPYEGIGRGDPGISNVEARMTKEGRNQNVESTVAMTTVLPMVTVRSPRDLWASSFGIPSPF